MDYIVNYKINVDNQIALERISAFTKAAKDLSGLDATFASAAAGVDKLSAALNTLSKSDGALAGIKSLSNTLNQLSKSTEKLANGINIKINANTATASRNLQKICDQIGFIKKNSKLTISASTESGGKNTIIAGGSTGGSSTSTQSSKQSSSQSSNQESKQSSKQKAGASSEANARNNVLNPRNPRQVLGPTYFNSSTNMAAEMVKGFGYAYAFSTLASGIASIFKDATDYNNISQTTMNILGSHDKRPDFMERFNATNREMRDVGVETKFTAPQVAEAGKFLAMAGLNVDEIKNSIRPISDISLVGDTDLGATADVVTNIMTSYKIPSQNMNNAADILTMTFTKTNTTLMELAESFKMAGTVAHETGMSFETASAALGILGNAGMKGTIAGTTFRQMVLNMIAPNKAQAKTWEKMGVNPKDENGNLRNLGDILEDLKKLRSTMSQGHFTELMKGAFRVTAVPGALALVNDADKLKDIVKLNENSTGIAANLANAKKNTIEGLWMQVTSAFTESGMKGFEGMQEQIRNFLHEMLVIMQSPAFVQDLREAMQLFLNLAKAVVGVFRTLTDMWRAVPDIAKPLVEWFIKIQMFVGIFGGIIKMFMSFGIGLKTLGMTVRSLIKFFNILQIVMDALAATQGILKAAVVNGSMTGVASGIGGVASNGAKSIFGKGVGAVAGGAVGGGIAEAATGGALAASASTIALGSALIAIPAIAWALHADNEAISDSEETISHWGDTIQKINGISIEKHADSMVQQLQIIQDNQSSANDKLRTYLKLLNDVNNSSPELSSSDPTKIKDLHPMDADAMSFNWYNRNMPANTVKEWLKGALDVVSVGISSYFVTGKSNATLAAEKAINTVPQQYRKFIYNGKSDGDDPHDLNYQGDSKRIASAYIVQKAADWGPNSVLSKLYNKDITYLAKAKNIRDWLDRWEEVQNQTDALTKHSKKYNPTVEEMVNYNTNDFQHLATFTTTLQSALRSGLDKFNAGYKVLGQMMVKVDKNQPISVKERQNYLYQSGNVAANPQLGEILTKEWWIKMGYNPFQHRFVNSYYKNIKDENGNQKIAETAEARRKRTITILQQFIQVIDMLDPKMQGLFGDMKSGIENALSAMQGGFNIPIQGVGGANNGGAIKNKLNGSSRFNLGTHKWEIYKATSKTTGDWIESANPNKTKDYTDKTFSGFGGGSGGGHTHKGRGGSGGSSTNPYRSHYDNGNAAPKQIIVRIGNLMKVDKIDMADPSKRAAVVNNLKSELATALIDVVADFDESMG